MEDLPPPQLADPPWLATPPRDGWLGCSAFALTKVLVFWDHMFQLAQIALGSGMVQCYCHRVWWGHWRVNWLLARILNFGTNMNTQKSLNGYRYVWYGCGNKAAHHVVINFCRNLSKMNAIRSFWRWKTWRSLRNRTLLTRPVRGRNFWKNTITSGENQASFWVPRCTV